MIENVRCQNNMQSNWIWHIWMVDFFFIIFFNCNQPLLIQKQNGSVCMSPVCIITSILKQLLIIVCLLPPCHITY